MTTIIQGSKSRDKYYYDRENMTVSDKEGNVIKLYENLDDMSEDDIVWYLDGFFHEFYKLSNELKINCQAGKRNRNIKWEILR